VLRCHLGLGRHIPALNTRRFDFLVASMSPSLERASRQAVDFTEPYYTTSGSSLRRKSPDFRLTKASLKGKTFGAQRALSLAKWLEDNNGRRG